MSFREKSAWVTLVAIVLVSAMYVFHVPRVFAPNPWAMTALVVSLVAFIVIEVVAWLVLRFRHPQDAHTPKDELERLIELKALRLAMYVYVAGSFLSTFVTVHHVRGSAQMLGACLLVAFIVAGIVNYTARIVYYRRHA